MTKTGTRTEIIFILDRSGSMSGLEEDTIGGFNSMLKKQKKENGEAVITTILFDDQYELLHDRKDIKDIQSLTREDYFVRGSTALLDAMGKGMKKIEKVQKQTKAKYRSGKVLFIIITDGMENASKKYSSEKIQSMVKAHKKKDKWEFIFLGANIDALATAKTYGISKERAINYHPDTQGTQINYTCISEAISEFRSANPLSNNWKKKAEEDYHHRQ